MFLHNPYLFVVASLLYENGQVVVGPSITGTSTTTSSLHRLKEVDEDGNWGEGLCDHIVLDYLVFWLTVAIDGGFFIFGDLSISILGRFRLQFTLFEFDK
jgi:hypothetical protein